MCSASQSVSRPVATPDRNVSCGPISLKNSETALRVSLKVVLRRRFSSRGPCNPITAVYSGQVDSRIFSSRHHSQRRFDPMRSFSTKSALSGPPPAMSAPRIRGLEADGRETTLTSPSDSDPTKASVSSLPLPVSGRSPSGSQTAVIHASAPTKRHVQQVPVGCPSSPANPCRCRPAR